jgi:hypothetical protein
MSLSPRTYQNGTVASRIYQQNGTITPRLVQNGYASIGRVSQYQQQQHNYPPGSAQLKAVFHPLEYHGNDIVELNVGGCAFATTYLVLAESKSPYFKSIFKVNDYGRVVEIPDSITKDKAGRIFINRDGDLFRYVLQYLRDGQRVALPNDLNILKMLRREAEFFSLQDFIRILDQLIEQQINSSHAYRQSQVNEEMLELLRKMSQQNATAAINGFTTHQQQFNGGMRR